MKTKSSSYKWPLLIFLLGALVLFGITAILLGAFGMDIHFTR